VVQIAAERVGLPDLVVLEDSGDFEVSSGLQPMPLRFLHSHQLPLPDRQSPEAS
jgi:hypothetical protein